MTLSHSSQLCLIEKIYAPISNNVIIPLQLALRIMYTFGENLRLQICTISIVMAMYKNGGQND